VTPSSRIAQVPHSIMTLNPEILAIIVSLSLAGLRAAREVVVGQARAGAPMLVVVVAIALGYAFDLEHEHHYHLWQYDYVVGPRSLVTLPAHLSNAIVFPDWSDTSRRRRRSSSS
jgi:hypothetical protein